MKFDAQVAMLAALSGTLGGGRADCHGVFRDDCRVNWLKEHSVLSDLGTRSAKNDDLAAIKAAAPDRNP